MKKNTNISIIFLFILTTLFSGCAKMSRVEKVNETESYFKDAAYQGVDTYRNDNVLGEKYRVFSQASTGNVPLSDTINKVHRAASNFCQKSNKIVAVSSEHSSTPPHILGNWPRTELIFACVSKNAKTIKGKYADLQNLKQLLDNGVITQDEFNIEKNKFLLSKKAQSTVSSTSYNNDIQELLLEYPSAKIDNKKWLFIISIEDYADTDNVLYAKHSAEMFEKVAQKTLGISKRNTYSLINNRATSGRIKDRLRMLLAEVRQGDKIYFYYAGHGIPDPSDNGQPYILPSDKLPSYINQDKFFSLKNIYTMLDNSNATEVIAFVDSCFSGSTDGKSVLKGVASSRLVPKSITIDKSKMTVITAGSGTEFANMYEEKNHRLFSYYLMKSLLNGDKNIYTIYKKVSADVYHQSNIMGPLYRQEPVLQGSKNFEL